ncbi:putative ribonuclease H-like domain-containing protein [Tanacetum coccineum]
MIPKAVLMRANTVSGKNVNTARPKAVVNAARQKVVLNDVKGNQVNAVKASACWELITISGWLLASAVLGNPQMDLQDQGVIDNECLRHMTGNMSYLTGFEKINGGYVAFGGNPKGGKITGKGTIKTGNLDFENVHFLTDESHVLLKVPRKNNMYSVDLKNIVPKGGLTCLFAKATSDESKLWHRRLGHINLKTMNKLDNGNLVRGLPLKLFENDQACVAYQKGKQHKASLPGKDYILRPLWPANPLFSQCSKSSPDAGFKPSSDGEKKIDGDPSKEDKRDDQEQDDNVNITNNINTASDGNITNNVNVVSLTVNTASIEVNVVGAKTSIELPDDPNMPELEDIVYLDDDEDVGAEADMNNLDAFMPVSPILTIRIHKDHLVEQIIRDLNLTPQTRRMTKNLEEHGLFSSIQQRTNHKDFQNLLKSFYNSSYKKDERGILIKNKARLVAQGYTQEEGIDYDEVFAPISRIETIRLFLAYASFKDLVVYQMDVKSAFLYGKIEEEVYVCQPLGFEDPDFLDRVYKVEMALYRLHQAPKAWYETLSTYLLDNGFQRGKIDKTLFIRRDKGDILLVQVYVDDIIFCFIKKSLCTEFEKMMHKKFQMSSMGELTFFLGLQVKQKEDGTFISQDKYVTEILKKFGFTDVKTTSTPMETQKALLKDEDSEEVDVHLYRSMIGSLMCLTSSRPDIMFTVLAYTDSDYARASLDRKSTIGEAEYVAASSCCGQVLWIQNQLIDYRDSNEKKLIQMIKIHTDKNVADLLTKAFNVSRFQYLITSIGMLNL